MDKKEDVLKIFALRLRKILAALSVDYNKLQEIRLRAENPLMMRYDNKEYFITSAGCYGEKANEAYILKKNDLRETLEYISNYSMYAYEEEIRQGFITVQGGHRVGIAGKIVMEHEKIKTIKHISFLNIRFAHQIKGCADYVMPYLNIGQRPAHTLIVSPPCCGKTTLLRDIIRQLSNGNHTGQLPPYTVGVVDERSEIGACYMGIPQNDIGIRTDILDCCPKSEGMMMLIRSMSPQIIAVDEIGSVEDMEAIQYAIRCGCTIVATVHGSSLEDVKRRTLLRPLLDKEMFERIILLSHKKAAGNIKGVYDAKGVCLCMQKL